MDTETIGLVEVLEKWHGEDTCSMRFQRAEDGGVRGEIERGFLSVSANLDRLLKRQTI